MNSKYNGDSVENMPANDEREVTKLYEMACIAPDGLGYGEGTISAASRVNNPNFPASKEQIVNAIELLIARKSEVIVPIEEHDDGCGDGRPTGTILQRNLDTGEIVRYNKSRLRAKIFGGGLQVASSMWRAVAGQPLDGETVLGDRTFIAGELNSRGMKYGAHTDNHAEGQNCGCGAIDKYPLTTKISGKYREQILETLGVFYDNPQENAGITRALETRAQIANDAAYMSNASGRETMDFILNDGAVVKELDNEHLEAVVIINDEPNNTVDQDKVAQLLQEAGLPDTIQVFVVDAWRGHEYAEVVADIAATRGYDREASREIAMADFYINQLSVATTLTDGTLAVIHNKTVV